MHTVSLFRAYAQDPQGEVQEGSLRCDNPACGRVYPILDGVPVIVPDLPGFLRGNLAQVVEGALHPETAALLSQGGPDDEPYPRMLEHLSIYLDAHWGDRATPPPDGPGPAFGMSALAGRLGERGQRRIGRCVELGCSVGRGLAELARGAELVVGVDLHFGALRRARRVLLGEELRYPRRVMGRHYRAATIQAGELATDRVALVCGDALDPPLCPGVFERVVALNLLDSVPWPGQLISVVDGLCAPGGEVILCSPYSFQSGIVEEAGRLPGPDPGAALRGQLSEGAGLLARYLIDEETELPWGLRRDQRSAHTYLVHYLRCRKA
jgi:SAM-dependent methyltransferase